jgi:hypothetical protein
MHFDENCDLKSRVRLHLFRGALECARVLASLFGY